MDVDESMLAQVQVLGRAGTSLGQVEEVFRDRSSGDPDWVRLAGSAKVVPLGQASFDEQGRLVVPYDEATVLDAPDIDTDAGRIHEAQEADLSRHYGLEYGESDGGPIIPGVPTAERAEPTDRGGGAEV